LILLSVAGHVEEVCYVVFDVMAVAVAGVQNWGSGHNIYRQWTRAALNSIWRENSEAEAHSTPDIGYQKPPLGTAGDSRAQGPPWSYQGVAASQRQTLQCLLNWSCVGYEGFRQSMTVQEISSMLRCIKVHGLARPFSITKTLLAPCLRSCSCQD
jgi:hypothetical protein